MAELREATCALFLDDVFITGSRLDAINRFLREHKAVISPRLTNLHYWTALATPHSESEYQARFRGLTGHHSWTATLQHFAKFLLPDWHESATCPWCAESKLLGRVAQYLGEVDGPLTDRLSTISDCTSGVTVEAFFSSMNRQLPALGAESVALGAGASPMQVLFACASAVQQLRDDANNPLDPSRFPAPSLLATRVLEQFYSERLLWLGLIRSLHGTELEPTLKDFLQAQALSALESQDEIISAELAIAWLLGKMGSIPETPASRRFFERNGFAWDALASIGAIVISQH